MKIVVTHMSPDLDAITSSWLIKRFLTGWENAEVKFVSAGERLSGGVKSFQSDTSIPIEIINGDEVLHVDTGMGPLDHHQTSDMNICGASLTFDYVKKIHTSPSSAKASTDAKAMADKSAGRQFTAGSSEHDKWKAKEEAISRMVKIVVDIDHFQEVFWDNPTADYHEFSLLGVLEGLKFQNPNQDSYYVEFIFKCLDALLHNFENKIWAEKEIAEKGKDFNTKWGKGLGIESINDSTVKLAQKMGYMVVIRKDPRKGYVRIKARPLKKLRVDLSVAGGKLKIKDKKSSQLDADLTLVHEKLSKMDPEATWFLHVSKKMLLNGTPKNPKMKPTTLSLDQIIKVLESI